MKKRIRFLPFVLALALAVSLLAGCGGNTEEATEEAAEALSGEAEEDSSIARGAETEEEEPEEAESEEAESDEEEPEEEEIVEVEEAEPEENALAAPSVNGALHLDGIQLVDEAGEPVQLRGISTHGLAWFPEYVNADCLADLHAWGANVFRLAMYTAESGGYCTDGDPEQLKNLVKEGVELATAEDMYVIIDWHILSEGSPSVYQDEAEAFFDEMSKEYADYNNVLYEICNEPNGGTGWAEIKAYAEDIIPIIRANDPDAVIIVGTPTWSQDVDQAAADPITDYDNILYTLHFYAATHTDDLRNKMKNALEDGLPIFVTEYGICDASGNGAIDEEQANTWVSLMNDYGVSYCMWNLSNKAESSAILNSDVTKTSGFTEDDLSQAGRWVYTMLQASLDGSVSLEDAMAEEQEAAAEADAAAADENGMVVSLSQTGSWEADGQTYEMYTATVKNVSGKAVTSWEVTLDFDEDITLSDSWNGTYSVKGSQLTISNADYNGALADGESAGDVGFILYY